MITGDNCAIDRSKLREEFRILPGYMTMIEDNYCLDAPQVFSAGAMVRVQAITMPDYEYTLQHIVSRP